MGFIRKMSVLLVVSYRRDRNTQAVEWKGGRKEQNKHGFFSPKHLDSS
jgi:hypothetical protein